MSKILICFGVILSCTTFSYSWDSPSYSTNFSTDTRTVTLSTMSISTSPVAPLLVGGQRATKNVIYFTQTSFPILVSTGSNFNSPSTMFQILPSTPAIVTSFSPDGISSPWSSNLYVILNGTDSVKASIYRSK